MAYKPKGLLKSLEMDQHNIEISIWQIKVVPINWKTSLFQVRSHLISFQNKFQIMNYVLSKKISEHLQNLKKKF